MSSSYYTIKKTIKMLIGWLQFWVNLFDSLHRIWLTDIGKPINWGLRMLRLNNRLPGSWARKFKMRTIVRMGTWSICQVSSKLLIRDPSKRMPWNGVNVVDYLNKMSFWRCQPMLNMSTISGCQQASTSWPWKTSPLYCWLCWSPFLYLQWPPITAHQNCIEIVSRGWLT